MRFLASGGFNTLVSYLVYLVLLHWFPYRASYSVAFASGIALAYLLNRYYVFRQPGGALGPLFVVMIYAGQYLLGLLIVSAWVDWIGGPAKIAPLVAVAISLPLTYLCNAAVFGNGQGANSAAARDTRRTAALWLRRIGMTVLVGLPIVSLALNAIGWLHSGFDLPFFDDWRAYATGQIDSLDPAYLFIGINDTMAPVGFALDAIAQRMLDGNSVAYQFLSMVTVLGLLLLLQWRLLKFTLDNRMQAAACFVLTLLMLQPGSYWGRENLAYHQALPLVFLLTALWLVSASAWKNVRRLPAILVLGALAGMTYISGAFGALAAGVGVVAMGFWAPPSGQRTRILQGGAVLAAAGAITAAIQFKVAMLKTMTAGYRGDARLALPHEPDFWMFLFGKVGRSLLLPESEPFLSLLLVLVACAAALTVGGLLVRRLRADPHGRVLQVAVIYAGLASTVFVYLLMVAAGRTYLRGPEVTTPIDVFVLGFSRFHFFWAALLWPWVAAVGVVLVRARQRPLRPWLAPVSWFLCAASVVLMVAGGALAHYERHRLEASFRNATMACLMAQLQKGDGIDCTEFNMADLTPAYIYATRIGASFIRYFPVLPVDIGVNDPSPWFRLSRDAARVDTQNVSRQGAGYVAATDAQFEIRVGRPDEMDNCVMLDVTAVVAPTKDDELQIYFRRRGQRKFSEENSRMLPLRAVDGAKAHRFRLESETGFEDTLRLDPVSKAQSFSIPEVEVRCRLRYSTKPFFTMPQPPQSPILVASEWLDQVPGDPYAYRAGKDAQVTFLTAKPLQMAQCAVLDVEANIVVQQKAEAQLFWLPRGHTTFSEALTAKLPVNAVEGGEPQHLRFRIESAIGFDDKLRFDPVDKAQDIRLSDLHVSCHRRLSSTAAQPVPATEPGQSTR